MRERSRAGWTAWAALAALLAGPGSAAAAGDGAAHAGFALRAEPPWVAAGWVGTAEAEPLAAPRYLATDVAREKPRRGRRGLSDGGRGRDQPILFTAERARILLRSLTVPGWGEATVGRNTSATAFGLAEVGVWTMFTAFRVQMQMRRESYERTARLLAGIDLRGRDEEFRRIVGSYLSSEQYNLFVVHRDAANLHYDDPVRYRQYIAEHEVRGADAWSWDSDESLLRYRAQRKNTQRAALRANTALALAVVNRLLSAVNAARVGGEPQGPEGDGRTWNFEVAPPSAEDATAFRLGVRARF